MIKRLILSSLTLQILSAGSVCASNYTIDNIFEFNNSSYTATIHDTFSETGGLLYSSNFSNAASSALASFYGENEPQSSTPSFWNITVDKKIPAILEQNMWTAVSDKSVFMSSLYLRDKDQDGTLEYEVILNKFSSDTNFSSIKADSENFSNIRFVEWTKVSNVPIPAAAWLMGSGLLGLMGVSRNRKSQNKNLSHQL